MKRINLKTKLASWLQVGCKAAREEQFCLGSTITYPNMAETNEKELAYRVLRDKTPVLDIYFDGSYTIREDVPEEERSVAAIRFHNLMYNMPEDWFAFWLYDKEHRTLDGPDELYYPPSDKYVEAYRILRKYDFTPDYMDEEEASCTEVLVFGGAKVPWETAEDGNITGAISAYIR